MHTGQCILNVPDDTMVSNDIALARTTGSEVVPAITVALGYRFVKTSSKWQI
jgi:hypothetical protein